jgi:hypothetical protein
VGDDRRVYAVGDAEPNEDGADMALHGALHEMQAPGDPLVGEAGAEEDEHVAFAVGEGGDLRIYSPSTLDRYVKGCAGQQYGRGWFPSERCTGREDRQMPRAVQQAGRGVAILTDPGGPVLEPDDLRARIAVC